MMRKKITQFIVFVFISGLFVSCLDNFTERSYYTANVTDFAFNAHDSCPTIEDFVFNIDQRSDTGLIYNLDSLPFGSDVDRLYPSLTIQTTNGYIFFNDSLWEDGDSIDFSSPVIFKNTSSDGLHTRVYKINVNVHQVDPDSMIVRQTANTYPTDGSRNKVIRVDKAFYSYFALDAGGLTAYRSTDNGITWSAQSISGITEAVNINSICTYNSKFYLSAKNGQLYSSDNGLSWSKTTDGTNVVTLFGQLNKKYKGGTDHLIGLVKDNSGKIFYATTVNALTWTIGQEIDSDFPVSDYAITKDSTVTGVQFYTIATGLNNSGALTSKVYSTETGDKWVVISAGTDPKLSLVKRSRASIFYYEKYLVCFGGVDADGKITNSVYVSPDNGKGWLIAPDNWTSLLLEEGLSNCNIYVEHQADLVNEKDREYIWIFGGTKISGLSTAVWHARLNSMVFARR